MRWRFPRQLSVAAATAALLCGVGCSRSASKTEEPKAAARLVLTRRTDKPVGGHLPPEHVVQLETKRGLLDVAERAFHAGLGPQERVAYIDAEGLKISVGGRPIHAARAQPRGMGLGAPGVVYPVAAEVGPGSGVALMTWEGEERVLIPAPENLEGPAGYHRPTISPSGKYVVAFSSLSPRPSVHRITLSTGEVQPLSFDAPPIVGEPSWEGETLTWSTGDGRAALDVESGEITVR